MNEIYWVVGVLAVIVFCAEHCIEVFTEKKKRLWVSEYYRLEQVSPVGIFDFVGYNPFEIVKQVALRGGIASVELFIVRDFPAEVGILHIARKKTVIVCRESFLVQVTEKEFEGIVGHEIGHMLNFTDSLCDFMKRSFSGFLLCGLLLFFTGHLLYFEPAARFFILAAISLSLCSSLLSAVCYGAYLVLRKQREFAADKRALSLTRYPTEFVNFLSRMVVKESSCEFAGFFKEKITDTHPPTWKRVRATKRILRKRGV